MKNFRLLSIFLFFSSITLAQSKKELISILNNRVDSLNQIVASERSDKQKLNTEISNLKSQIKELERNKENLSNDKSTLETKNNTLNKQLKIKQDSLLLVITELLKYRHAYNKKLVVKQDNSGLIKTVTIGTQVWMLENLNVSTFKNGVAIPEVQDKDAWNKASKNHQPAWCYYDNDPKNGAKYGKLYNWYAVIDTSGLCPQGWHVPSDADWEILITYLGGKDVAGAKMKAKSGWNKWVEQNEITCPVCNLWSDEYRSKIACHRCKDNRTIPNVIIYHSGDGNNISGLASLPGGIRLNNGYCSYIGEDGYWWSSTENNNFDVWYRYLYNDSELAYRFNDSKGCGISVRCLRD